MGESRSGHAEREIPARANDFDGITEFSKLTELFWRNREPFPLPNSVILVRVSFQDVSTRQRTFAEISQRVVRVSAECQGRRSRANPSLEDHNPAGVGIVGYSILTYNAHLPVGPGYLLPGRA